MQLANQASQLLVALVSLPLFQIWLVLFPKKCYAHCLYRIWLVLTGSDQFWLLGNVTLVTILWQTGKEGKGSWEIFGLVVPHRIALQGWIYLYVSELKTICYLKLCLDASNHSLHIEIYMKSVSVNEMLTTCLFRRTKNGFPDISQYFVSDFLNRFFNAKIDLIYYFFL